MASEGPVRVLHVLRWVHHSGGGIRAYLASVVRALEGSAISTSAGSLEPSVPPAYLADVPHVGRPDAGRMRNLYRFWTWARTAVRQFDVVHVHGVFGWPFLVGAGACLLGGTPFVVSPHGALEPGLLWRKRRRKMLYLRAVALPILRHSAAILATSPQNARSIRALDRGLPVRLVMPGVACDVPARAPFAPADGVLRVAHVGRFDAGKGLEVLIRAIRVLRDRGCAARLDLVGAGALEPELKRLAADEGIEDRVAFRGYLDGEEKWAVLRNAHVMAVPSFSENFSFAAAEALVVGVPVVATSGVGLSELIAASDCGSVVSPGDVAALASALAEHADPAIRAARSARALEAATRELSHERMGRELEAAYRAAIAGGGSRA